MSQARFCLDGMKKVQCPETNLRILHAETGPCGRRICLGGRGWSSRFSPSSATSLHSPMRRGRLAGRRWSQRFAIPAIASRGSGLPPPIPGALDKAAVAAYAVSTARPAGPAAAPARAPGRGWGSRAVWGDGGHAAEASAEWVRGWRRPVCACSDA